MVVFKGGGEAFADSSTVFDRRVAAMAGSS
jgi:hypothetical protein